MNDQISYAIMEDRLPLSALKRYLMRQQKFQPYCNILCSGFTTNMLTISYKIDKMKKQLEKKYADELADPERNMYAADKIEKELLDYAKKELKDDISMDMYDSKAKGSFANNFKNIFVMKGAIKDPDPTKGYDVAMSSYIDGISRDDYSKLAKALAAGPYSRSKKTPEGGYNEKLLLRAFQHLTLAPKGTDCGTKRTIEITLDKYNIKLMMYSYIVEGNKLIELNSTNKDKYLGKTVRMRFSSLCEYKEPNKICNVCAGNLFYRAGFKDIGVAMPQVASALKLKALKAFHDSTVKLHEIDVWKAFGLRSDIMRIELVRKNGNEFYFSNNYKYRMNARIISIDIDGTRVKQSDYKMIGPRGVKLNRPIDSESRVYANVLPIRIGNILMVKYKNR